MLTLRRTGVASVLLALAIAYGGEATPPPPPAAPAAPAPPEPARAPSPEVEVTAPVMPTPSPTDVLGSDVPPPALPRLAVARGGGCAIGESGGVWCWGAAARDDEDAELDAAPRRQESITSAVRLRLSRRSCRTSA